MADQKEQNFMSHFLIIGGGTLLNMFIGLFTTPIITRIVDPNEYGQLAIFNMYTSIAVMVLCIGLDQALVRFYYEREDLEYKRALLKICFLLPFCLSIFVAIVVIFLSVFKVVSFEFTTPIMILLAIYVVLALWNRIAILLLRITYQSKKFSACNVLQKCIYVITVLILISIFKENYFFILTFSTVFACFVPTVYATYSTRKLWKFKNVQNLKNRKEIILFGIPFILSMGLTTLFQAVDKISLNHYCTYYEVGVYSSAMSLINIFAIIQSTFNSLWGPMQVEHYVKNPEDKSFIEMGNKLITIVMFFIGFSLIFVKDIFVILLGEKYREAAYIMPFLIFNPIMYTISETTCAGIGVSKKSYINIVISLIACITNVVGNTVLVPVLGGRGAAISTGISYIVFFICRTVFSNKYYYVNYKLWKIALLTFVAIGYALYNTFFTFGLISVVGYFVCIFFLVILYKDGIKEGIDIGKTQLLQIFKSKNCRKNEVQ